MSEKLKINENLNRPEYTPENHIKTKEHHTSEHQEATKSYNHEDIQRLETRADELALSQEDVNISKDESEHHQPTHSFVNKEIKNMAYDRLLLRARKHLSLPQKLLSQVIHQPLIDELSETTSKTVARPSGILGGGLLAFIGTSAYFYLVKTYGYDYNYFIFIALLSIGFVVGWSTEIILKLRRR